MKTIIIELTEDEFEEELNETTEEVEIFGAKYPAGYLLRKLDPTAFRCALADREPVYECGECGQQYDAEEGADLCCE